MKKIMAVMMATLVAVGLAGCAGMGGGGAPCENCSYAYVPVGKRMEGHPFCEVNGKRVDCKKSPAECPECAKAGQ